MSVTAAKSGAAMNVPRAPLPSATTASDASAALLTQLLNSSEDGAVDTILVRALGEEAAVVRDAALKAGAQMVKGPGLGKSSELLEAFERILDSSPPADAGRTERLNGAVLSLMGELGEVLDQHQLSQVLKRHIVLLRHASPLVAGGAARGIACAMRGALASGKATLDGEIKSLLDSAMKEVASAKTPEESRGGAYGVGACVGAAGATGLGHFGVMAALIAIIEGSSSKETPCARESAVLAIGQLSKELGASFEPFGIPMMRQLVALYADKDNKVAHAAGSAVRAMLSQLSPLAVKLVLPALYDGMEAVQWRTKVECVDALSVLAQHAPSSVGPRLPEAIPKLIECLANTNAKVVDAASTALPHLLACVQNSETQKLKPLLVEAFVHPDTTLDCIDEVMCTTFVNAIDGTSLAFIMPLLLRGLKDSQYELVKKAAVSSGNMCALVKDASDIAPYVPTFDPALSKCLEHPSPPVRAAAEIAKQKLLDGAGEIQVEGSRPRAIATHLREGLSALPASVAAFMGETGAELLEQEIGGAIHAGLYAAAPQTLADHLSPLLAPYPDAPAGAALVGVCAGAVEAFKGLLSAAQAELLAQSSGVDYCVDIQNCILAFAGRVLLRGCDLRFERGRRYGLIGQNGVGKTTLLNRLAAKDITGFPQDLKVWYIRHEVVCDDGVTVRAFMKLKAPPEAKDEATVIKALDDVGFPETLQVCEVNQLSGGWKMKLSIAISILHKPELLLLDEPTNHLDINAVKWLQQHLLALTGVTILVVSHDYDFIDEVCSDVTHYDNGGKAGAPCRLVYYPMGFKAFQQLKPEIAAGLPTADKAIQSHMAAVRGEGGDDADSLVDGMDNVSVASSSDVDVSDAVGSATLSKVEEMIASGQILPIRFPDPGKPEGIRTYRKPIMTMKNISFRYKEGDGRWILTDASVTVTLGSRAVLLGANGAGKSTFLKLLVGDLELEAAEGHKGEGWRHHNLRVSYIAQHSLHHLEEYLNESPIHYIQERFRLGMDAELSKLKTIQLTDDEKAIMTDIGSVNEVSGRQMRGKQMWYEVVKTGRKKSDTQWVPLEELKNPNQTIWKPYILKLVKNFDERQMALDSGMAIRPITSTEILAHLDDFGISQELSYGKIKQMSGGQRQRLVLCAAFWSKPHLIALDEPTNYLDNDTLAALTQALKNFKGAVVTVSHNEAFVAEIANEKWIVENGEILIAQLRDAKTR